MVWIKVNVIPRLLFLFFSDRYSESHFDSSALFLTHTICREPKGWWFKRGPVSVHFSHLQGYFSLSRLSGILCRIPNRSPHFSLCPLQSFLKIFQRWKDCLQKVYGQSCFILLGISTPLIGAWETASGKGQLYVPPKVSKWLSLRQIGSLAVSCQPVSWRKSFVFRLFIYY